MDNKRILALPRMIKRSAIDAIERGRASHLTQIWWVDKRALLVLDKLENPHIPRAMIGGVQIKNNRFIVKAVLGSKFVYLYFGDIPAIAKPRLIIGIGARQYTDYE